MHHRNERRDLVTDLRHHQWELSRARADLGNLERRGATAGPTYTAARSLVDLKQAQVSLDLAELQELDDRATEASAENAENAEAVRREHERLVDAVITVIESSRGRGADDIAAAQEMHLVCDLTASMVVDAWGTQFLPVGNLLRNRIDTMLQLTEFDDSRLRMHLAVSNDDTVKAIVVAAHRIATKKEPA